MIRTAITTIKWLGAGLTAFVVVVYLIAVAINWQDREASAAARELDALYRDRPAVADRDNAFVYMLGFDVAPGEDPQAMGLKRIASLQRLKSTKRAERAIDPLGKPINYRASRSSKINGFVDACRPDRTDCAAAFDVEMPGRRVAVRLRNDSRRVC